MLRDLLPPAVCVAEAFDDEAPAALSPGEKEIVARAVPRRQREFATGRRCARQALGKLGVPGVPILSGPNREPLWPPGIVGSITHCEGYRAAAVARRGDLAGVGIDAEPHAPLPAGVLDAVALPQETARLGTLPAGGPVGCWDRVLFCAKEAVYKAWFPLARRWLGFGDAEVSFDPGSGTFIATLLVTGPVVGAATLSALNGRFAVRNGLVIAAVTVPPPGIAAAAGPPPPDSAAPR